MFVLCFTGELPMKNATLVEYVEEFKRHVVAGMSRNEYDYWVQHTIPLIRELGDEQAEAFLRDVDLCGYYLRVMPKQVQSLVVPFIDRLIDHLKGGVQTA